MTGVMDERQVSVLLAVRFIMCVKPQRGSVCRPLGRCLSAMDQIKPHLSWIISEMSAIIWPMIGIRWEMSPISSGLIAIKSAMPRPFQE